MKEDIAKKWSEALRSGKYTQTKKRLANVDRTKHCCLGVLCELAIEDGVELAVESITEPLRRDVEGGITSFDGHCTLLPYAVRRWADVSSVSGYTGFGDSLTNLNDDGKTFNEIADVIDEGWRRL